MKNQLEQYQDASGDFLKDPLIIQNEVASYEKVLQHLKKFESSVQAEGDVVAKEIIIDFIEKKRDEILTLLGEVKYKRPASKQDLTFEYKTFDEFVQGFAQAMFTGSLDVYANFIVKFVDYLANPAILIKNYRVP